MTLWSERQVMRDLGIKDHGRKDESFDKLFETPPHVEYIAREPKTAARLRRLMGTNVLEVSNFAYMNQLEQQTIRAYKEDLQERNHERAHQAAQLAHLQLWESVLLGRSTTPPEKLEDPCMRQVREHQLKIQGLEHKARKLGTSVLRVMAMPHVWSEPSHYKPARKKQPQGSDASSAKAAFHPARSASTAAAGDSEVPHPRHMSEKMKRLTIIGHDRLHPMERKHISPHRDHSDSSPQRDRQHSSSHKHQRHSSPQMERRDSSPHRDRRDSRVMPPRRPPVVFPEKGPRCQLLTCDIHVGRVAMRKLGTSDFIIPHYYRPKAPDKLKAAKNLDELYRLSNSFFDGPYPSMDNRDWDVVCSNRIEKKLQQIEQEHKKYAVKTFGVVK